MDKNNYHHKDLIKNMPTAFAYHKVIYDQNDRPIDYVFSKVNNKFEELTGLNREDVINKKATEVLETISEDTFDWIQFYGDIALNGKSVKFHEYSETLGSWYEVKAYSKEKGYFTTIFNDITEKKEKENELKKKNKRLTKIFNNSNDIIYLLSWPDLQIKFASRAVEDIFGYTVEEFKEDPLLLQKITHSNDKSINEQFLKNIEKEGYAEREFRVVCKDGSTRWMYDKSKMIYDDNNKPIRIEGVIRDITRRKKAEKNLKKENILFDSILESIQEGISVLNPDLSIRYINPKMEEWYKDKLSLTGKKCFAGFYDKDSPCENCPVLESLESGQMEKAIKELSDEFALDFIEIYSYPIWDEDKENITGIVEFVRDISEREEQRKELEMMDFSVNNSDLLIFRVSPDGITEYVNETVIDKLGYSREELIGKEAKKFLKVDNYIEREKFWEQIKNSTSMTYERKYITKAGKVFPVEITSQYFKYKNKEYEFVFSHDITERKKQEEKIRNQRERMKYILKGTDAGTWEWNVQTGKTIFNEKWAEIIGYTLEEISPTTVETWKKFTHPKDLEKSKKMLKKHFNGEMDQYKMELRMKHKQGHWIWTLSQGKVVSWTDDGKPLRMFGTHLNITDRKKRVQELKSQHNFQKMLADISSELVGISNANFDYEINNSLKKIGRFFGVDRSYIFEISDDKRHVTNTHEWSAEGITSQKDYLQNLSIKRLPWLMKQLYNQEIINVFNVKQLGKKAKNERKLFQEENTKSIIIVPIFINDELRGFFGFDSVREKKRFNQKKINKIKIITDVIKSALVQYLNIEKIEKLTYKDNLTGLYNRRFFEGEMQRLDTKRQLPISIIMADVNGLKIINDSYGHEMGDQILIETGKILKQELRDEDILARHGGDEFTILLPQTSNEVAQKIISRLKAKNNKISKEGITISFSLGVATKVEEKENISEILKEADDEMYRNKLSESRSNKNKIVQNLLNTLEAKSSETKEHALRMTQLAYDLGERMNLSISELNRLSLLATLHDIGKTTISEEILTKPGELTQKEWEIIKEHPARGFKIASASEEFIGVAEDILYHHEHWNGSGYPDGLTGKEIPYLARIIAIIDAYDVMTNERPYSKAKSKKEALIEIKRCAGGQFDPELVKEFLELKK